MNNRKQLLLSIGLVLVLVLMIVGISYAAFQFTGAGKKENSITTGVITMKYTESSNTISMNKALPTTDATGKKRLTEGEYFDFTLEGTIQGTENINWEIAAEDVTTGTKKIDGKYIKLYLTSLSDDGTETEVMKPSIYTVETSENSYTGRPVNMMSLAKGSTSTSFSTKYRLRMYVDESYNPQGDGGDLSFSVKINAYGKTGDKISTGTLATKLIMDKANTEELDYNSATEEQKKEMWTFTHETTEQTEALTDYRYIGANPDNYVKFNEELWRIIGVFETDDGTGKVEKRLKIIRNESIGNYSWDYTSAGTYTNEWPTTQLNTLLNSGAYYNRTTGIYYNGSETASNIDFTTTGLKDEAKAMIGDAKWYLGGTANYNSSSNGLASHWYKYERGTNVYSGRSTNWTGKVGLMYPSDYGYATSGGTTTNRASCLAKELYNWDTVSDCVDNDWMYKLAAPMQWTITPRQDSANRAFVVFTSGYFPGYEVTNLYSVNPAVYLNSAIKVTSGTGEQNNPYILE